MPPLHHRVVTARVTVEETPARCGTRGGARAGARALEAEYPDLPGRSRRHRRLGTAVLPALVPAQHAARSPSTCARRRRAARGPRTRGRGPVPERPRRDDPRAERRRRAASQRRPRARSTTAQKRLFDELDGIFAVTSIRSGFVGGGFDGRRACRSGWRSAARHPRRASSSRRRPSCSSASRRRSSTRSGPPRIANIETLGYARAPRRVLRRRDAHAPLAHLTRTCNAWYLNFDHGERVDAMFRPGSTSSRTGRRSGRRRPTSDDRAEFARDFARHGRIGHAARSSRPRAFSATSSARDGTLYPKGTAVPQRADFNTLDNPFAWSADPARRQDARRAGRGVHFVVFNPTARRLHGACASRWTASCPTGRPAPLRTARASARGSTPSSHATHRQNFLVPPRAHRSFPLSELKP